MECVPCTRWALPTGQRPIWLCQSEFGHNSLGGREGCSRSWIGWWLWIHAIKAVGRKTELAILPPGLPQSAELPCLGKRQERRLPRGLPTSGLPISGLPTSGLSTSGLPTGQSWVHQSPGLPTGLSLETQNVSEATLNGIYAVSIWHRLPKQFSYCYLQFYRLRSTFVFTLYKWEENAKINVCQYDVSGESYMNCIHTDV